MFVKKNHCLSRGHAIHFEVGSGEKVNRFNMWCNLSFRCQVCSAWTVASDARRVRLGELSAMMYRARAPERLVRIARKLLRLYKDRIFLENNLVNKFLRMCFNACNMEKMTNTNRSGSHIYKERVLLGDLVANGRP